MLSQCQYQKLSPSRITKAINSDNMDTLGHRVKTARRAAGLSQRSLADKVGISQVSIQHIESGRNDGSKHLISIAKALKVNPDWLQEGTLPISPNTNVSEPPAAYSGGSSEKHAPVISWVNAGDWAEAVDLYEPGTGEELRPVPANTSQHAIWLKVVGDSMTSPHGRHSFPDGCLILVDPEKPPGNGSFVVAKMEDSNEVTFKQLVIDAGTRYLRPLNPQYPVININGNCRIIGTVKKMEMDL